MYINKEQRWGAMITFLGPWPYYTWSMPRKIWAKGGVGWDGMITVLSLTTHGPYYTLLQSTTTQY